MQDTESENVSQKTPQTRATQSLPLILIVDDATTNITYLTQLLEDRYRISFATSGAQALQRLKKNLPDLILLDINMPEMDGYTVCRKIQAEPETALIPVIFVSANLSPEEKITAFDAGGVDYITKPFHAGELIARIRTQIRLREAEKARARASDIERENQTKSRFIANMSHEVRTPMHAIKAFAKLGLKNTQSPKLEKYLKNIIDSSVRLDVMLNNLFDLSKLDTGQLPVDPEMAHLGDTLQRALEAVSASGTTKDVVVLTSNVAADDSGRFDSARIQEVLQHLLDNAIKASPLGGTIDVALSTQTQTLNGIPQKVLHCAISDQGVGIDENQLEKVFESFTLNSRTADGAGGKGLGLAICRAIVEAHGGRIWAVSPATKSADLLNDSISSASAHTPGSEFHFMLPVTGPIT